MFYLFAATDFRTSVLRQDWWWSLDRQDFVSYASDAITAWSPAGIGSPVEYPTGYLAAGALLVSAWVLSPFVAQMAYVFFVGSTCAIGALRFVGQGCDWGTRVGIVLFATFNPWVYTETVAGHFYMIVAYSATMALFGALRDDDRSSRIALCFLVIVQQIQFVFVPLVLFLVRYARRRDALPIGVALVFLLPAAIGIVLNYDRVIGIPYVLEWERGASIAPLDAVRLIGYFAEYGTRIAAALGCATFVVFAVGAIGFAFGRTSGAGVGLPLVALGVVATLYATGSRGPISGSFETLVLNVPQSGLFRELYDLLAYTAMAYLFWAVTAARRFFGARCAFVVAGCVLAVAWSLDPPSDYTVAARSLPRVTVEAASHTRYAMFPAFQPFASGGRGSGLDPNVFALRDGVSPLDEFEPAYPAVSALAAYAATCDTSRLAALGVTDVVVRPWLEPTNGNRTVHDGTQCSGGRIRGDDVPQLGIAAPPAFGTLVSNVGAGNVFFGDRSGAGADRVVAIRPDRRFADPKAGWIDARLVFESDPRLGQAFGGAATTSSVAVLPLDGTLQALVYVRGALLDQAGRTLTTSTSTYRWIPLAGGTTAVRCAGTCVVALQGDPPAHLAADPPARRVAALNFRTLTSFAVVSSVAPGPARFLRYAVAYDAHWLAFADSWKPLAHVRVDAVTNGWRLPARARRTGVLIINVAAAIECAAIFGAICVAAALVCVELKKMFHAPST